MSFRTHYDNLKVSRDAPPEVIRAAYKSLSQKYHPDRNPSADAERVMQLLNVAFEVLSDSVKRREHDDWIRYQEQQAHQERDLQPERPSQQAQREQGDQKNREPSRSEPSDLWLILLIPIRLFLYALGKIQIVAVIVAVAWLIYQGFIVPKKEEWKRPTTASYSPLTTPSATPSPLLSKPQQATGAEAPNPLAQCLPMLKAPSNKPWPAAPSYVTPVKNTNGYSKLTIDNRQGGSNVYIKLAKPTDGSVLGVREAYVPAGKSFTMNKIPAGSYVVKYKDVQTGCNSVSEKFDISELHTYEGVEYTEMSLTLYTIRNGNMNFKKLPESSF